eukprot:CAMPEP_0172308946 /NCGR_PEP_ID=MMETSP1058-20130122/9390_1 /TAXON_ID=83371 /ORGANISM="Detonula confervacea, Strain CCMP 353" /LENGTH=352 /DNA_ID=CAMNT_0013021481 /DNA_START=51 /DNA_END=1109 /DNA_ORIENTATION=+
MKKQTKAKSQNPLIKGYLPIRIALPPIGGKDKHSFTSFIYIKEHTQKAPPGGTASSGGGSTLFIANAPANGPIRTDLFLRALFEPYGDILRATVAKDPRISSSSSSGEDAVETFREAALMGLDDFAASSKYKRGDGKFAHVVFTSGKEMRKALKKLKREISEADDLFAIRLDGERMDQLKMETAQLVSSDDPKSDDDESEDHEEEEIDDSLTGIHAIAAQARQKAGRHISREKLMQMCNDAMASFESDEAEAEQRAKNAAEQPDEDGFITVSHKATSFGAANDLEEDQHHRRKAGKRNRKRKAATGADELPDFYRFQLKETRKKEVQDLKTRFEEDLRKVKKMKEARAYRPF